AGIERRRRTRYRSGQEADDRRQSIRQHRGYAVARPDSYRCERIRHGRDLFAQRVIGDADSGICKQKRGTPGWCELDQFEKCVRLGHKLILTPETLEPRRSATNVTAAWSRLAQRSAWGAGEWLSRTAGARGRARTPSAGSSRNRRTCRSIG